MRASWRRPLLPVLLQSDGRALPIPPLAIAVVPAAPGAPAATPPSPQRSLHWFWLAPLSQPCCSSLAARRLLSASLSVCLLVSQQMLFPSSRTATVLVLQVFSLPLSSLKKYSDCYPREQQTPRSRR